MKNYKKILILLIVCFSQGFLFGQRNNTISLQPGLFVSLYKDEVSSPLTHWVPAIGINLGYQYESDFNIHKVNLSFAMGEARNSISGTVSLSKYLDPESGELIEEEYVRDKLNMNILIDYSYHRKIFERNSYSIYPGVAFNYTFNMQLSDYPTVNSYITLGPSVIQELKFSQRDNIRFSLSLPLLSYIVRPPFAGVDDELLNMVSTNPLKIYKTGQLMTVNKYFSLDLNVEYRHLFFPWLEGSIAFHSRYSYIAEPRPKREFTFDLMPGINFKF
ncbi:MAG: hypothetical protein JEY91_03600 [Spirochaetaceae bacterium]|nr:hypothetical protein [Spirochaetaceae bacterium]